MSCEPVRQRLGEFLAGALEGEDLRQVERHLESCASCSEELADLQGLEGILWSLPPAHARGPGRRIALLAAAAALVVGLGVAWHFLERPARLVEGELTGAESFTYRAGAAVPRGQPCAALLDSSLELPEGSRIQARAGAGFALLAGRGVRLDSGEAFFDVAPRRERFEVRTPRGTAVVEGTSFRVQVKEGDPMGASGRVKAAGGAAAVVVVAVVTGAVLWNPQDGRPSTRLDAGKRLVAGPDGLELSAPAAERIEKLTRDNEALAAEREALSKARAELEGKLAALTDEARTLREKVAALESPAPAGGRPGIAFGKHAGLEELAGVNWEEMGEATAAFSALAKELLESGKPLDELPQEKLVQLAALNQKLVPFALAVNGKLPTHTTGNGEFTHPLPQSNILAKRLEHAGAPLSLEQTAQVRRFGEDYESQWDRLQGGYPPETLKLEKVLDELELKKSFQDRVDGILTEEQRDVVIDPVLRHHARFDIQSPSIGVNTLGRPVARSSREKLRQSAAKLFAEHWGIEASRIEGQTAALDAWLAELDSRLAPVPAHQLDRYYLDDILASGRAQAKLMKALIESLQLDPEGRRKMLESPVFAVPRLVEKEGGE